MTAGVCAYIGVVWGVNVGRHIWQSHGGYGNLGSRYLRTSDGRTEVSAHETRERTSEQRMVLDPYRVDFKAILVDAGAHHSKFVGGRSGVLCQSMT